MGKKLKKDWVPYFIWSLILAVNIYLIVTGKEKSGSSNIVKSAIIVFYQYIYFMLEHWINHILVFALIISGGISIVFVNKGKSWHKKCLPWVWAGSICSFMSIGFCVFWAGGVVKGTVQEVMCVEYYLWIIPGMSCLVSYIWPKLKKEGQNIKEYPYKKMAVVLTAVFGILLIPMLAISVNVFAHADDFEYGYKAHQVWLATHSFWEVFKSGFEVAKEFYFKWQGTYSSIFMMALHPGTIKEEFYHIVPMFFVCLISFSSYFFLKTFLQDFLKIEKEKSRLLIICYLLLGIQCMPYAYSAFFWYNGAIHYMGAHCVFLCFLTFLMRIKLGKRNLWNLSGALLSAIYVGGANLVSGVEALFVVGTIFVILLFTKKIKESKEVIFVLCVYLLAFGINVIAPGNYTRISISQGYGLVEAGIIAFEKTVQYAFGEWARWELIAMLLLMLPVLWNIAKQLKFDFPLPGLVVAYSWCYLAAMFFAPLYTITHIEVGRFQNIMFLTYVIWLVIDITYVIGWLQKKYFLKGALGGEQARKYVLILGIFCILMGSMSCIVDVEGYTFSNALQTMVSGEAKQHGDTYRYNTEVMRKNTENTVTLKKIENPPPLLDDDESEPWYYGMKAFYGVEKIIFE